MHQPAGQEPLVSPSTNHLGGVPWASQLRDERAPTEPDLQTLRQRGHGLGQLDTFSTYLWFAPASLESVYMVSQFCRLPEADLEGNLRLTFCGCS